MGKRFWKLFQVEFEDNWKPKRSSIDTKEWSDDQIYNSPCWHEGLTWRMKQFTQPNKIAILKDVKKQRIWWSHLPVLYWKQQDGLPHKIEGGKKPVKYWTNSSCTIQLVPPLDSFPRGKKSILSKNLNGLFAVIIMVISASCITYFAP